MTAHATRFSTKKLFRICLPLHSVRPTTQLSKKDRTVFHFAICITRGSQMFAAEIDEHAA
jgi:hypothetical protein